MQSHDFNFSADLEGCVMREEGYSQKGEKIIQIIHVSFCSCCSSVQKVVYWLQV